MIRNQTQEVAMKKMILTMVLAGGAIFAAKAGDFYLGLPGFNLSIGNGPYCRQVYAPAPAVVCGPEYVVVPPVRPHILPPPPPMRPHILPPPRGHHFPHGHHAPRGHHPPRRR